MAKSTNTQRARLLNAAITLLKRHGLPAEAVRALADQYDISKRQAYRYVKEAQVTGQLISIPDTKITFTVKLSKRLIQALRQYARIRGHTISEVVSQALETFLYKGQRRGQAEESQSRD
ncbi:MAG: hypothetical protein WBV95_07745 [Desulfobacterales bacterium]|jgi:AcrR family transcriptional regulator